MKVFCLVLPPPEKQYGALAEIVYCTRILRATFVLASKEWDASKPASDMLFGE